MSRPDESGKDREFRSAPTLTVTGKTRTIKGEERAFLSTATVGL